MARYLFLSHGGWGHIDFGGMSFLRTAGALLRRGNEVRWAQQAPQFIPYVEEHIRRAGIETVQIGVAGVPLMWAFSGPVVEVGVAALREYLASEAIDVLVAERSGTYAHLAAEAAGVPWAAIGTDGRAWRVDPPALLAEPGPSPRPKERLLREHFGYRALAAGEEVSDWLRSPYLNISYFPEVLFGAPSHQFAHSHFVGCAAGDRPEGERDRVVITFGNNLAPSAVAPVIEGIAALAGCELAGIAEVRVLAGDEARARSIASRVGHDARFVVRAWDDYRAAFERVRLAVGHGGTAFSWEALCGGACTLAIAPATDDQQFVARRLEALAVGRTLSLDELARGRFPSLVEEMLGDAALSAGGRRIQRLIRGGGGVEAAASLLARLAATRAAVVECASSPCCV